MWINQTFGDLFPGYKATALNIKAEVDKVQVGINAQLDALTVKVAAVNDAADATTNLLAALAEAGIYVNLMEPQNAGYMARLTAEQGDPAAPLDAGYSAGVMVVIQAASYAEVVSKYQKLVQILTTSSPAT
jgi:hypothetical protein